MNTPIADFLDAYAKKNGVRLHMPGHKGKNLSGVEKYDVTEIFGADQLFLPSGIIKESENNASKIFGADTFYSAEGSTPIVKAMLYLAVKFKNSDATDTVIAFRNAHRSFTDAAALIGFDIRWIYSEKQDVLSVSCALEKENKPCAVYITSPDYSGNIADVKGISEICEKHGVPLIVDAAHGSYLKFLSPSLFPTDLGAAMCCSSAHKTLPALTGAAYFHVDKTAKKEFSENAKYALSLFSSTSPSYLILRSLDKLNAVTEENFKEKIANTVKKVKNLKDFLIKKGFKVAGDEPLKLTVLPLEYGYTGKEFADIMRKSFIECDYCEESSAIFMFSPYNKNSDMVRFKKAVSETPEKPPVSVYPLDITPLKTVTTVQDAVLAPCEKIAVKNACGRVLSHYNITCPPAIPIAVPGEEIDGGTVERFLYFGIKEIYVIKK